MRRPAACRADLRRIRVPPSSHRERTSSHPNRPSLNMPGRHLLGTVGVGEKEAGPAQPGSPPSRPSVTALRGKVVVSSHRGFGLATSRRRRYSDGHARASNPDTPAHHTDTLAHPHARAPRALAHSKGDTTHTKTSSDPGSFRTPRVQENPLIASHAPSGWLVDRAAGLRARTLPTDVAPRKSPLVSIYNGGLSESICEQHRSPMRVLGSDPTFWGLYARPDVGRADNQRSFPNVFCLDTQSDDPRLPHQAVRRG